jgi:UDP-glucuronate decarboxylase
MHPNEGRVMSNFIAQALNDEEIPLYGDGEQTRSFCYVDDLVERFLRFMDMPAGENGHPGFPAPITLGNPGEFTIRRLAELIIKLTGSSSKLVFHPLPAADPKQRQPDITLAQKTLDWEPTITLESGLQNTIWYFAPVFSKTI